jgi:hypothetical protein
MYPIYFQFCFRPKWFWQPVLFPFDFSTSAELFPAFGPSIPAQSGTAPFTLFLLASSSRGHRPPPAKAPPPYSPLANGSPPAPLHSTRNGASTPSSPLPIRFPFPHFLPTRNGAINSHRLSSHPNRLRSLAPTLYKGPSRTAAHHYPLCCPLFHSFVPPSAAPPSSSCRHHLAPPPASLHHRTTRQRPR